VERKVIVVVDREESEREAESSGICLTDVLSETGSFQPHVDGFSVTQCDVHCVHWRTSPVSAMIDADDCPIQTQDLEAR
jgi:hypothetical protein